MPVYLQSLTLLRRAKLTFVTFWVGFGFKEKALGNFSRILAGVLSPLPVKNGGGWGVFCPFSGPFSSFCPRFLLPFCLFGVVFSWAFGPLLSFFLRYTPLRRSDFVRHCWRSGLLSGGRFYCLVSLFEGARLAAVVVLRPFLACFGSFRWRWVWSQAKRQSAVNWPYFFCCSFVYMDTKRAARFRSLSLLVCGVCYSCSASVKIARKV